MTYTMRCFERKFEFWGDQPLFGGMCYCIVCTGSKRVGIILQHIVYKRLPCSTDLQRDPDSQEDGLTCESGPEMVVVFPVGVVIVVAKTLVILRLWVRTTIVRKVGVNDRFIAASLVRNAHFSVS